MKFIITADDYGISPIIDDAIQAMVSKGAVTSVSGFANGVDSNGNFSVAKLKRLKQNFPNISVGMHFTLTSGKAVSGRPCSLTRYRKPYFKYFLRQNPTKMNLVELEEELLAQIRVFEESDLIIEHFSDHIGILTLVPETAEIYFKVIKSYNQKHGLDTPVRNPILTAAYIDEGCLCKSKMNSAGRLGGVVMKNVSLNLSSMKKQLVALQNKQLRTTDYFVEHLYKDANIDTLNCIVNKVPNLEVNPNVTHRVDEGLVVEVVTHLAERPTNYRTNPDYLKAVSTLRKHRGITISYLRNKRHQEYQLLKDHHEIFPSSQLKSF